MSLLLGCVADDFTGATDLAGTLVGEGMRTVQLIGVPGDDVHFGDADAAVIALKSRSIEPAEAVRQTLASFRWLKGHGAKRFFFKYCSTFDSTEKGNIGPVIQAWLSKLGTLGTVACPAFPDNGRMVFQGHLFVGDRLLSESGMEKHPLNPMTDPNLVRFLGKQTSIPVRLIPHRSVRAGGVTLDREIARLQNDGSVIAIVDATSNEDLREIGRACVNLPLVTGGSGMALGLPSAYRAARLLSATASRPEFPNISGKSAIVAGSCSPATLEQVARAREKFAAAELDLERLTVEEIGTVADDAVRRVADALATGPALIYSSAEPSRVADLQRRFGREAIGRKIEDALAAVAELLVSREGVRRLIVAGGETAGAVVTRLGVTALRIGPPICPGVPWTESLTGPRLALALKSGNFGGNDFFEEAMGQLR